MRYQQSVKCTHDYEVMGDVVISTLPSDDSVTFLLFEGDDCTIDIQECSEEPCLFDSLCTEPMPGLYRNMNYYDIHVYQMKHSHAHGLDLCQYDSYLLCSIMHANCSSTKLCPFGEFSIQSPPYGTEQCLLLDCGR